MNPLRGNPMIVTAAALLVVAATTVFGFVGDRSGELDPNRSDSSPPAAEVAKALVTSARAAVQQAASAEREDRKTELQATARSSLARAREIYQDDFERHKAEYDRFDKFIPKTDTARYAAREKAFGLCIEAQLHLALLTYDEAQTWNRGSAENKKLLGDGAEAFERIHARYRQMVAGLYARMWQGKCLEERGDIAKALGIYNELLEHETGNPNDGLARLQDRVRLDRLRCLRLHRHDYAVVIDEAGRWLEDHPEKVAAPVSLAIRWELACAAAEQAGGKSTQPAERKRLLRQALAAARAIHACSGEYQAAAAALIERLTPQLSFDVGDVH